MTERLTMEEIETRFKDEWVLLVDLDKDDHGPQLRGGRVAAHCKDRIVIDRESVKLPRPVHCAILYAGTLSATGKEFSLNL